MVEQIAIIAARISKIEIRIYCPYFLNVTAIDTNAAIIPARGCSMENRYSADINANTEIPIRKPAYVTILSLDIYTLLLIENFYLEISLFRRMSNVFFTIK